MGSGNIMMDIITTSKSSQFLTPSSDRVSTYEICSALLANKGNDPLDKWQVVPKQIESKNTVSPWKEVDRFGKWGKLNPRYVGPLSDSQSYESASMLNVLQSKQSSPTHTFHVSNLKKCYADEPLVMPLEGIHVDDKLQFVEEPVEIMEREIKRLKRSRIPLVKVRWNSRRGPEFTWEREDSFKQKYPQLFTNRASSSTTRS
ncbi:hypothetical protein Tco_0676965 [Tanacetum coccineum]